MKNILFFLLFFSAINFTNAQRYTGPYTDLQIGIGLFPTFLKVKAKTERLPMQISADCRLTKNFSIGAAIGYSETSFRKHINAYQGDVRWQNNFGTAGLRFAAHSRPISAWHIYGGTHLGIGMSHITILEGNPEKARDALGLKEKNTQLLLTGFVGTRCQLGKRTALFGEIGLGVSLATLGVSLRI
jgi:hypothetical protein